MKTIEIPKKSGGTRSIIIQDADHRRYYLSIARGIDEVITKKMVPGVIRGFRKGESPITNAKAHAGNRFFLQMDLKDFFDHCTTERVQIAIENNTLAKEATELAGCAKQGLSSSPAAANAAAIPMDREIVAALPPGCIYTRYADDLTISSPRMEDILKLRKQIPGIAEKHGQEVNNKKTRISTLTNGHRVIITGVALDANGHIYPTRKARRRARAAEHRALMRPTNHQQHIAEGHDNWVRECQDQPTANWKKILTLVDLIFSKWF